MPGDRRGIVVFVHDSASRKGSKITVDNDFLITRLVVRQRPSPGTLAEGGGTGEEDEIGYGYGASTAGSFAFSIINVPFVSRPFLRFIGRESGFTRTSSFANSIL